jgi:DNA-binding transcriptional LysR family regulator
MPKVTLDQWKMFHAVVEEGGYAQAADRLFKSQSTITYGLQKLQDQLGVKVMKIEGRKAVLTDEGEVLLRRSKVLLKEADELERVAGSLSQGWEPQINIVVDAIFPTCIVTSALDKLAEITPNTRIEFRETVLSGTNEALIEGTADIAITGRMPPGFLGQPLLNVMFQPVAHPDHPLHQMDQPLELQDLHTARQIVTMDTGKNRTDAGWLGAEQRWTVNHMGIAIEHVSQGLGFAWLPVTRIWSEIESGLLKPLNLKDGGTRYVQSYLVFRDPDQAGPGTRKLAEILTHECDSLPTECNHQPSNK